MKEKKEILIISTEHDELNAPRTLEALEKVNIKEGTLVSVEIPERKLLGHEPITDKEMRIWADKLKEYVTSKGGYLAPIEPQEVYDKRVDIHINSPRTPEAFSADMASEEIMKKVAEKQMQGRERMVIVVGHAHGPYLAHLLRNEFNVKFIPAISKDGMGFKNYMRDVRNYIRGSAKVIRHNYTNDPLIVNGQLSEFGKQKVEEIRKRIMETKWTMPKVYAQRGGKLMPLFRRVR